MFSYPLGTWTLEFPTEYRVVKDDTMAVLDEERNALVLVSLKPNGNICIERTYYAMICEIDGAEHKVTFHVTDEIG